MTGKADATDAMDPTDPKDAHDAHDALHAARAAADRDPQVGLRAVAALRRLVERLEALQVDSARRHHWSWEEIGAALGVSRQAVHKKHSRR